MADNYCESSSMLELKPNQLLKAKSIIDRVVKELEADEDYGCCGVKAMIEQDRGIWFHHNEAFIPEHLATIAQALLDELQIDKPFCFSWAYTCSKAVIDEFGGGACAVKRGQEPYWVDAMRLAMEHFR